MWVVSLPCPVEKIGYVCTSANFLLWLQNPKAGMQVASILMGIHPLIIKNDCSEQAWMVLFYAKLVL